MIIADTDVLIDYLKGKDPAVTRIIQISEEGNLLMTVITCFELLSGAGENRHGDAVRQLVAAVDVLGLDQESAKQGAKVRRELESRGQTIGMADSLIAGIAMTHRMPLLTGNQKHFSRVAGLKLA